MVFKKGQKLSEEHIRKIVETRRRNNSYVWSEEHRKKLSERMKGIGHHFYGKHLSEEHRKKLSNTFKRLCKEEKRMNLFKKGHKINKGIRRSDETKRRLSIANKGQKVSEAQKKILSEAQKKWCKEHKGSQFSGHHHSKESKKKMSLNNKRVWLGKKIPEAIKQKRRETVLKKGIISPKKDTSIEVKIQSLLKQLKVSFIKHKVIWNIKHKYPCDIFVPSMNLVIECDGRYWHNYPIGKFIDVVRNNELIEAGYNLLRLWEQDINKMDKTDFNLILAQIME